MQVQPLPHAPSPPLPSTLLCVLPPHPLPKVFLLPQPLLRIHLPTQEETAHPTGLSWGSMHYHCVLSSCDLWLMVPTLLVMS